MINLTQHQPTSEQIAAGVTAAQPEVSALLTFTGMPDNHFIELRAEALAEIAKKSGFKEAMIGGAPYLMAPLERALRRAGVEPMYAFSERVSVDVHNPDGTVTKTNQFKHVGFIPAC